MRVDTINSFSFDGAGMKGYMEVLFLIKILQQWGINEEDLWKNANVLAGTSIGGIIALAIGFGIKPSDLVPLFTIHGPWIFTIRTALDVIAGSNNASTPSNRPNIAQRFLINASGDDYYRSVSPDSNYGSARLKSVVTEVFGTATMQDLKTNVVITSFSKITETPIIFSNLKDYPEFVGQDETLVNVALATSAAPFHLPPNNNNTDGGVSNNNPSQLGINTGLMLKPTARRINHISFGGGLTNPGFFEDGSSPIGGTSPQELSLFKKAYKLFEEAMVGSQESVAKNIHLYESYVSNSSRNKLFYHRFQPLLDKTIDTNLDNSDAAFITYMEDVVNNYYNENIDDINNIIGHLTL